jgi:hypothetical protein
MQVFGGCVSLLSLFAQKVQVICAPSPHKLTTRSSLARRDGEEGGGAGVSLLPCLWACCFCGTSVVYATAVVVAATAATFAAAGCAGTMHC